MVRFMMLFAEELNIWNAFNISVVLATIDVIIFATSKISEIGKG